MLSYFWSSRRKIPKMGRAERFPQFSFNEM